MAVEVVTDDAVTFVIVGGGAVTVNVNPALQSLATVEGPILVSPTVATERTYAYQVNPLDPGPVLSVKGLDEPDASGVNPGVDGASPVVQYI